MATLFNLSSPPPPRPTPQPQVAKPQVQVEKPQPQVVARVPVKKQVVTKVQRPQVDYNPWGFVKTPFRWGTGMLTVNELYNEILFLRLKGYGDCELHLEYRKLCEDPGFQKPFHRGGYVILPYQKSEDIVL